LTWEKHHTRLRMLTSQREA